MIADIGNGFFGIGFDRMNDALLQIKMLVSNGTITENSIVFKGLSLPMSTPDLIRLYRRVIFKGDKVIYKDYETGGEIKNVPPLNRYWQTYVSMLSHLGDPKYIIIYRLQ